VARGIAGVAEPHPGGVDCRDAGIDSPRPSSRGCASEPALDELRGLLEVERTRITAAIAYLQEDSQRTMDDEIGDFGGRGVDNHPADMASVTATASSTRARRGRAADARPDRPRLAKLDGGRFGTCERCGGRSP
jgi:RNA polymerase-binding transcription factor DksA